MRPRGQKLRVGGMFVMSPIYRNSQSELHILREILMHKYGREFSLAVMENRDDCVPKRVSFLSISFQIY